MSGTPQMMPSEVERTAQLDADLAKFARLIFSDGGLREVRVLGVVRHKYPHISEHVETGYFKPGDLEALLQIAGHYRGDEGRASLDYGGFSLLREPPKGVYFSLNPIKSAAYAKGPARMVVANHGETSADADVERRTTLLLDFDAPREVTHVSATEAEKDQARAHAAQVRAFLNDEGWPRPIEVDSGNGFQLLYRIDLAADDGGLVERVLKGLAATFPRDHGGIDVSVHNAARIARLPFTWNRKGHSIEDRPHRLARVLSLPDSFDVVPIEKLQQIADLAPETPPPPQSGRARTRRSAKHGADQGIDEAVARWNNDHRRTLPTHNSPCEICGSPDGLKASSGDPSRWTCFSSRHEQLGADRTDGAGVRGSGCFSGDALDIEAWTSKRTRVQVLRDEGYLPNTAQRRKQASAPSTGQSPVKPSVLVPGEHEDVRVGNDEFVANVMQALPAGAFYRRDFVVGELVGPRGRVRFLETDAHRARAIIDSHAQLVQRVWNQKDEQYETYFVPCSRDLACVFLATAARSSHLRVLRSLVHHPVFDSSFTLVQPGWNAESGIFYDEPVDLEGLQPAQHCGIDLLKDLTIDFPFRDAASLCNAYGMLLTALCALAILGNIPLHFVLASLERTGKGLLIDVLLGIVLLGEAGVPTLQLGRTEEEREKRITAAIIEGATVLHFDNVPADELLDSPSLASLATSRTWRGRMLGHSQIVKLPNTLIPVFSGNNPKATGELTKRIVPIALQPRDDRPEERNDFVHEDVRAYARQRRRAVLEAMLGMVESWRAAGCPPPPRTIRMGGFEDWVRVVGGILNHAGATGWMTNYGAWVRAGDEFAADAAVLIQHWWDHHQSDEVTAADILKMVQRLKVFPRVTAGLEQGALARLARRVLGPLDERPVAGRLVKRRPHGNASRYWLTEVSQ